MTLKSIGAALALSLLAMTSAHAFGQNYHQPNEGVTFSFSIGSNGSQSAGIQFNSPAQYGNYGNHGTYGNYGSYGATSRYPYGYVDPYERRAMQLREAREYRRQQIREQRQLARQYDRQPQYRDGTWIFVSP